MLSFDAIFVYRIATDEIGIANVTLIKGMMGN